MLRSITSATSHVSCLCIPHNAPAVQEALDRESEERARVENRLQDLLAEKEQVDKTLAGVQNDLSSEKGTGKSLAAKVEALSGTLEEQVQRADAAEQKVSALTAGASAACRGRSAQVRLLTCAGVGS